MGRETSTAGALFAFLAAMLACASPPASEEPPPSARPEIARMLREDRAAVPHPADGGGSARLVESESTVPATAGGAGRWRLDFAAGPEGVALGGAVYLQVSPFWGWSTPQVVAPDRPGFTVVTTPAPGVELETATIDRQLLRIGIAGRGLAPGETLRIDYGAGEAGARADSYAESASTFWLAVDGDGDGRRRLLAASPSVPVVAGPAARLVLSLPASARAGETVRLTVALLDAAANAGPPFAGEVEIAGGADLGLPASVRLEADDLGRLTVEGLARAPGVFRLTGRTADGLSAVSNPLVVSARPRIVWADLHGHSAYSDGTGSPAEYFSYARDVAALDVAALTDHDSWGLDPLATRPDRWEEIEARAASFDEPERFVALAGFEWTSWLAGHRHVLFFGPGSVLDSLDSRFEYPAGLWDGLRGLEAVTIAHHSAGGPVAVDWRTAPDVELEPVTEIASVHGSSEAPDAPRVIYSPVAGNFVRDVLDRGVRLGLVGSGDSHDGHPGLAHLGSPRGGGLAGILTETLDRGAVLAALRARRVYATNGPRIALWVELDGAPMGSAVTSRGAGLLAVEIAAVSEIERVDIVRAAAAVPSGECGGVLDCAFELRLPDLSAGEYVYVRVVQGDGGAAWSSPFFVD